MLRKAEAARQRGRAGEEEEEVEGGGGGKQKKAGNLFPPKQRWGEEEEEGGGGGVLMPPPAPTPQTHPPKRSKDKGWRSGSPTIDSQRTDHLQLNSQLTFCHV